MARLTVRDYKKANRRRLDLGRYRDFITGAVAGIVLASVVAVYLMGSRHDSSHEKAEGPRPYPQHAAAPDPQSTGSTAGQKYDFYEMLPNFEMVVPEKDREVKRDLPTAPRIERPGIYVLQVGSYRNQTDADRVRSQLALQGIDAKVQRVAVDADVWHRVRIGPITRLDELNRLRKQLRAADFDALVVQIGD